MIAVILIILVIVLVYIFDPCAGSHRTKSGRMYRARNLKTAEMIDVLRDISVHLTYKINPEDGEILRERLQNTSFKELYEQNPKILGWNFDKGREIGVKMYDDHGNIYPSTVIIETVFHELAHSLTDSVGHQPDWEIKDAYLQTYSPEYVKIFELKKNIILNE